MRFCFLFLTLFIFSCGNNPQPEIKKDSVVQPAVTNSNDFFDSATKDSIVSASLHYKKPSTILTFEKTINGASFQFEIDSTANFKELAFCKKSDDIVKQWQGIYLYEKSDRRTMTGKSMHENGVGNYEIIGDTLFYYRYAINTTTENENQRTSTSAVQKKTFLFQRDGTIKELKSEEAKNGAVLYDEVTKKLSKEISEMEI